MKRFLSLKSRFFRSVSGLTLSMEFLLKRKSDEANCQVREIGHQKNFEAIDIFQDVLRMQTKKSEVLKV